MVVPMDSAGYAAHAYAKARGVAGTGGLTLDRGTLAPLGSSQLGLHAALARWRTCSTRATWPCS